MRVMDVWATWTKHNALDQMYPNIDEAKQAMLENNDIEKVVQGFTIATDRGEIYAHNRVYQFFDDFWDATNKLDDIEQSATEDDIEDLESFARAQGAYLNGDLRPEVLAFLNEQYPAGSKVKIGTVQGTPNKVSSLYGKVGRVVDFDRKGMLGVYVKSPDGDHEIYVNLRFGQDQYRPLREDEDNE